MSESDHVLFNVSSPVVHAQSDVGVAEVLEWFRQYKDVEQRFGDGLRQSIDEVLDGQRTGRFDPHHKDQLDKTEKTYLGTKVEIVIRAKFELPRGDHMDYKIAGHEVDAKWTIGSNWTIPREAVGHICLLMRANDHTGTFDVGVLRIQPDWLNNGTNNDGKKTINAQGRGKIVWICKHGALPQNFILSLPPAAREKILAGKTGQRRVTDMFRLVRGVTISRNATQTVAQQLDPMKRVRDARITLSKEGIAILGHQNEGPRIAAALGLPIPAKGELMSVRLVRVPEGTAGNVAEIGGELFAAIDSDTPTAPLPTISY
ncbi:NaeI family type II restriction endonuclease [Nocardia caishijiensis]|uniref:NaeI family type II restriction endonuclease n=1 Tax=Nocardia caishijiensis TaxID=184756 RepID=UPI0013313B46|nr:NaeI family type II restriction endonuclease [Nocardia caishijiensis]